jgi:VWFA-related protein
MAQEQPASEETFYEAIQVQAAEVEVVVVDRDGNRILGLTREDFALYEDGEPVEITSFAAYGAGAGALSTAGATAAAAPPVAPPTAAMMVLLDNQSLTLQGRKRLLDRLRQMLAEGLGAEHEIAVTAQDAPGTLRMLLPPTRDVRAVLATLDEAERSVPRGNIAATETARLARAIQQAPGQEEDELFGGGAGMAETERDDVYQQILVQAGQLESQAYATAAALEQLVQGVAGLPGRKVVLLISGGIPHRPADALLAAWRNRYSQDGTLDPIRVLESTMEGATRGDATQLLARTAAHANAGRVTIYALGAPAVPNTMAADFGANEFFGSGEEWIATGNIRTSLEALALPTGGLVAFDDGGSRLALAALRADLESYYSLAYTPRERARGRDSRLRVEVRQPGLKVRHRSAHRLRTGTELMVEHTRSALLFGREQNPLGLTVEVGAAEDGAKRGQSELPLTLTLPFSEIVLLPAGAFHEGKLTVHIAATDEEGRTSAVASAEVPVRVPNEQLLAALSQPLVYRTRLAVRDTRQRIAVTVRDELGNQVATTLVRHPPETGAPHG